MKVGTFVTLGNLNKRFDRLVSAVLAAQNDLPKPIVVQCGHSSPDMSIDGAVEDDNIIFIDFVDPQLFHDLVYRARVIIGHAGVGTYLSCRKYGKIPLMMAREKQYFEHVDDHQLQYLKVLVERGDAFAVNSSEDIRKVNSFSLVRPVQNLNERLIEDLKKYLEYLK